MIIAKPLTEQECLTANLPAEGVYPFMVVDKKEKESEKVGAYFSIKILLYLPNDKTRNVYDALFFTDTMMWKTRHFYKSCNRMDIYDSGNYSENDLDNLYGYAEIKHRKKKDSDELEIYVRDYVSPENPVEHPAVKNMQDLPF